MITSPTTRAACARPTRRAFHLVDIENLLALEHGQSVSADAGRLYSSVARVSSGDLILVAADESRLFSVCAAFPGARVRPGYGADGADLALIDNTDLDHIANRFDTIVIGSGDGRFLDVAYRARRLGLEVIVVSRPASLSGRLAPYADVIIDMPTDVSGAELTIAA